MSQPVELPTLTPSEVPPSSHYHLLTKIMQPSMRAPRKHSSTSDTDSTLTAVQVDDYDDDVFTERTEAGRSTVARRTDRSGQRTTRLASSMDPGDVKQLVLRLHRPEGAVSDPEMMTADERKIYDFLQRTTADSVEEAAGATSHSSRRRSDSRVWTEDAFRKLSLVMGDDFPAIQESKECDVDKQRRSATVAPMLPPIYRQRARRLTIRQWELDKPVAASLPLTQQTWEELKNCRYLRMPRRMQTWTE